jgi:hypothetical protein
MATFTEDQLAHLTSMRYLRQCTRKMLARGVDLADGFTRHKLGVFYRGDVAFDRVMADSDGNPSGVEYKHSERADWAFVLADASHAGSWRVQTFFRGGFSGHEQHATLEDAVSDMVVRGYTVRSTGALAHASEGAAWYAVTG